MLAKLHASGFLREVWLLDEGTETRRRRVAERTHLVAQMTRLENRVHSLFGKAVMVNGAGNTEPFQPSLPEPARVA